MKKQSYYQNNNNDNEEEEEYNFQPIIYTNKHKPTSKSNSKSNSNSKQSDSNSNSNANANLPVHLRLYQSAKQSKEHIEQLSIDLYTKDEHGNPLFHPQINRSSGHNGNNGVSNGNNSSDSVDGDNMKVQEYLYRDALVCI